MFVLEWVRPEGAPMLVDVLGCEQCGRNHIDCPARAIELIERVASNLSGSHVTTCPETNNVITFRSQMFVPRNEPEKPTPRRISIGTVRPRGQLVSSA